MKNWYLFLLFLCGFQVLRGQAQADSTQPKQASFLALGNHRADANILRWAPADYVLWQDMQAAGILIERYEVNDKGRLQPGSRQVLTPAPIRGRSIEAWKQQFGAKDTAAATAAQAMFGKALPIGAGSGNPFESLLALEMQQDLLFSLGMLMADWRPDLADYMGLRFEDRQIRPEVHYVYRLYTAKPVQGGHLDTVACVIGPKDALRAPIVYDLQVREGEKSVVLSWSDEGNVFPPSGYFVERSSDQGKTFMRLNRQPQIKIHTKESRELPDNRLSFVDSLGQNYQRFLYRVVAFNAFGEFGEAPQTLAAMGRDRSAPAAPLAEEPVFKEGEGLTLRWQIEKSADIKGFVIGHSNEVDAQYTLLTPQILPPDTRSFTDPAAKSRGLLNYYIISVIDTAGNVSSSLPRHHHFPNDQPPAIPSGLKATVDSLGHLLLTWKPNTEKDLIGYNVFFANSSSHLFTQLNGEPVPTDTFRMDISLKTLTEKIYFKVVALDEVLNASGFSEVLEVKKPDHLPPVAPLVRDVFVSDKSIQLVWHASPSHDAAKTILFKRAAGEEKWKQVAVFPLDVRTYTDTAVVAGRYYDYCLQAQDDDGLLSELSSVHQGRAYPSPLGAGVDQWDARKHDKLPQTELSWQLSGNQPARIYLYKALGDGQLQLLGTADSKTRQFTDKKVKAGNKYRYALKVVYDSGAESAMTAVKELMY